MKRQALGKGLSSLIPDKSGLTTLNPQPAGTQGVARRLCLQCLPPT